MAKPDLALAVPAAQALPVQEPGVRLSRALPYELHADGGLDTSSGAFTVLMSNTGRATAAFHVRSANPADVPRCYTVEPGRQLRGQWNATSAGQLRHDLEVHGPNGFLRAFRGASAGASRASLAVQARYQPEALGLVLSIRNLSTLPARVQVTERYSGETRSHDLRPGDPQHGQWAVVRHGGWYDLVITVAAIPTSASNWPVASRTARTASAIRR